MFHLLNKKGFTLIEIMLSLAVIALLAGFSFPVFRSFQIKNDLSFAAVSFVQTARRANALAREGSNDTAWGVITGNGSTILFKGATFAGRDATFDETFALPTTITPSGAQEIIFEKFTGSPQATGTITFTSNTNETRTVTIHEKGMVQY